MRDISYISTSQHGVTVTQLAPQFWRGPNLGLVNGDLNYDHINVMLNLFSHITYVTLI